MRATRTALLIMGLAVLLGSLAAGQGDPAGGSHARGKTVQKAGTVEAGVEGGCLILRDTRDHKLYNIIFPAGKKPEPGREISFTGTLNEGATMCMEGIAVNVTSWKPLKGKAEGVSANKP